jgi:hypothetical protein
MMRIAFKEEFSDLIKYFLSIIAIALIIISCSHGKTRFFPKGEGLDNPVEVTIIRNRSYCAAYPTVILLDEVPIAFIRIGEYVTFFVESGVHYLRVDTGVYGNFEKGNKYYFLISPNFFDSMGSTCSFEIEKISEEEGLKRAKNSKKLVKSVKEYKIPTETAPAEKEKPKLASVPKSAPVPRIGLRRQPIEISSEKQITEMLKRHSFFDSSKNPHGSFKNHFFDNKDGTVTDNATGLMWQKSGTLEALKNKEAKKYIDQLNIEGFAGHRDWRLPNVEQLASLLEKGKINGVHLDPVFSNRQITCWTVDRYDAGNSILQGVWIGNFKQGKILRARFQEEHSGQTSWAANQHINRLNYVKAVRQVK